MLTNNASRRKQLLLILLCDVAYTAVYVGRYSYNANITVLINAYGVSRAEAGLVGTFFFFSYGAAQLVHSILCKHYSGRYMIPFALFCMAGINGAMLLDPPFAAIKYLWMINGLTQSLIWPTVMRLWGENLDADMTSQASFFASLPLPIGTVIAYGAGALFTLIPFRHGSFWLGLIIPAAVGVLWLVSYDKLTAGGDRKVMPTQETKQAPARKRAPLGAALLGVLILSGVLMAINGFVRDGLNTWTPNLLKEMFRLNDGSSIVLTLVLPLFGIFGSALAVRIHARLHDFRALGALLCLLMTVSLGGLLLCLYADVAVPTVILLGATSCLVHAVSTTFVNIVPLSFRDHIDSGLLSGVINACSYVGSTVSAYGLGAVADGLGWNSVVLIMLVAAALASVLALASLLRKKA